MLIWYAQANYIPFAAYQIKNGGVYKHTSENAQTVDKNEVDFLVEKARTNADVSNYKFTIDGPNGKLLLEFPATTTNSFDFTSAKYDLELQSDNDFYSGGGKYTIKLLFGNAGIVKRYSKSTTALGCQS